MFEDIITTPSDDTKVEVDAKIVLVQCPVAYKCAETCSHRDLHEPIQEGAGSTYCTQKPCEIAKDRGWGTVTCIP